MLAPCLALYEQISLPVAGLCTVTFFPVTFFPTCPLFLFFLSLYSYCYPNELLPFFLFLFFPLVHCYFLSCYFFSYLKLLLSFLFLIFPLVHCYFLSCYFFSCYFFSYLKLLLSFLLPFFLLLSFRAPFAPDLRRWINSFSGSDFESRLVYKTLYFCYFFTNFGQQF